MAGAKAERPNRTFRLKEVLGRLWPRGEVRIRDTSNMMMFTRPLNNGQMQLKRIRRYKHDLVIGIDFLFWFGYGPTGFDKGKRLEVRLAKQQRGLKLLEQLDCKVLLGDYPDMTGAARRMLAPHWIPNKDALTKLNAVLYAWAKKRDNVHIFPMAKFVKQAKETGLELSYGHDKLLHLPPKFLLQTDRLHATRLGMAVLVHQLGHELRTLLGRDHVLLRPDFSLPGLIKTLRLQEELPENGLQDKAAKQPDLLKQGR